MGAEKSTLDRCAGFCDTTDVETVTRKDTTMLKNELIAEHYLYRADGKIDRTARNDAGYWLAVFPKNSLHSFRKFCGANVYKGSFKAVEALLIEATKSC